VRGHVVDIRGNPVRDAVVEQQGVIFAREDGQTARSFGPVNWIDLLAVTNENGDFEVAYSKPAKEMILQVSPRAMSAKLFTEPTGPDRKTLTVSEGATIRGRLVQNGKPVANAQVGLSTHSRMAGTTFPEIRIGTREDGTFAMTNVPAGRVYYLYGKMESLAPLGLVADLIECATKDDGQEVNVGDILVKPAYALRGKVVLTDGKPIPPDMHVNLFLDNARDSQTVVLGPDGLFEFKGLANRVYDVAPSVKGYPLPEGFSSEVLIQRDVNDLVFTLKPAH
jgi:hypothetical protein